MISTNHSTVSGLISTKESSPLCLKVAERRLPDVIVAGVKKCGTGAVMELLKFHKNIAAPGYGNTENDFFDDFNWAKGVSYFISKMPKALPAQLVVTKSQTLIDFPNQDVIYTKLQGSQVNSSARERFLKFSLLSRMECLLYI